MTISLRGHHLLCLLGYRGMGYSAEYVKNMTNVHRRLLREPETECLIVEGPDQLCACFPADGDYHCESRTVGERDALIIATLGLAVGQRLAWSEILARVAASVKPEDLNRICATCPWLAYGVCQEGVRMVGCGQPLPAV
ncbi:DUF1284 domain-containing protein [Paenibacillus methanolicus]|uniref:DUF1284 domain-containing protein n=1 Tax=Paenibacillus methanolicus TaxID=582686 RepID=A0A5S5CM10_9BACL|nr:DUF1284 domain-containing protein [Paenibacillus methanolicus]TYP79705.1 hypothetical protein BCM02_101826 [Paenibacillus methanolicus]